MAKTHRAKKPGRKKWWLPVALAVSSFLVLAGVRLFVNHTTSGDEPHYLVMNLSMAEDHDLDLTNQYGNKQYYRWYPADIAAHAGKAKTTAKAKHLYSFHGFGLPVFLEPFFMADAKNGDVFGMLLIATAVVVLSYYWVLTVTKRQNYALLCSAILVSCYFFNGLAGYIYPDLLATALLLGCFILYARRDRLGIKGEALLGFCAGYLVFVHFKMLAFSIPFLAWFIYKRYNEKQKLPYVSIVLGGLLTALFFVTLYKWFGVFIPSKIYASSISLATPPYMTVPAMLFDKTRGAITYNPVLLFIFPGLFLWYKSSRQTFLPTLLLLAPSLALLSVFNEWQGGYSPTGRYVISYVPLLLPALAYFAIAVRTTRIRYVFYASAAVSLLISLVCTAIKMPYATNTPASELQVRTARHLPLDVWRVFPRYTLKTTFVGTHELYKTILLVALTGALLYYGYYLAQKAPLKHQQSA